jgi:hypothetical protein
MARKVNLAALVNAFFGGTTNVRDVSFIGPDLEGRMALFQIWPICEPW